MIKDYLLKRVKVSDIKFDEENPNKMSAEQLNSLRYSLRKFGQLKTPIIDQDFFICDGEQQIKAYIAENVEEINVFQINCSSSDRRLIRQTMNKLHGTHDTQLDYKEFESLLFDDQLGELALLLAQPVSDLKKFMLEVETENKSVGEDDFDTEQALKEPKYKIEIGDVWQLGNHRLMCGDSTKESDVGKLMNWQKADLLLTDPPYGINIVKTNGKIGFGNGKLGFHNKTTGTELGTIGGGGIVPVGLYRPIINDDKPFDPKPLLSIGKNQIIWGGNYFADKLPISSCWLIWDKRKDVPSNNFADCEIAWTSFKKPARVYSQIWSGLLREGNRKDELIKRVHPTQKPVGIHCDFLNDFSKTNENIADFYGGSGTTLIACEKTNRNCYMMEIDPTYCGVIIERWEKFTNKKAIKLPEK